ncbi:helix-turn-helix domain-containing protein [Mesorhizobium sp. M1148]|uniref:helix-turn-helix domain-containing protein n=3 Tax=Mesorhizobium TaxID=68287 RepID=UPI00333C759E
MYIDAFLCPHREAVDREGMTELRIPMRPDSDSETKPDAYGVHPQTETRKIADSFPARRGNWGMAGRQRVIDDDQKLELLRRMEAGETVSKLADEVGISRQRLYEWRDHLRLHGNLKSRRRGRPARTAGVDGAAQLQSAVDVPSPQERH